VASVGDLFHCRNKIGPRIAPRPDLYGARCTSDRAAIWIYIATTNADVKLPRAAHPAVQRGPSDWQPPVGHRWATSKFNGKFRMKKPLANPTEQRCANCDGTGFPTVRQPAQPGRRMYSPPCKECGGKGRIPKADN